MRDRCINVLLLCVLCLESHGMISPFHLFVRGPRHPKNALSSSLPLCLLLRQRLLLLCEPFFPSAMRGTCAPPFSLDVHKRTSLLLSKTTHAHRMIVLSLLSFV